MPSIPGSGCNQSIEVTPTVFNQTRAKRKNSAKSNDESIVSASEKSNIMEEEKSPRADVSLKRVSFSDPLVTNIMDVPAVDEDRMNHLFYTSEEINAFKREIRNILRRRVWFDLKKLDVWSTPLISDEDKDKLYYSQDEIARYDNCSPFLGSFRGLLDALVPFC